MALLPLAGWADNFSEAIVTPKNIKYGTATLEMQSVVLGGTTITGYVVEDGFFNDAACEESAGTELKKLPVREEPYYVKVTHPSHTGFAAGKFYVEKTPLTITYNGGDPLEVNYKATPNFTLTATNISVTGWVNDEDEKVITGTTTWGSALKAALKCKYEDETSTKNANWDKANGETGGAWNDAEEKGYDLKFYLDGLNAAVNLANYEVKFPANEMKVYPIKFVAAAANGFDYKVKDGTYKPTTAEGVHFFTYDGTAHTPQYVVKYGTDELTPAASSTATTGDYYVTYTWCATVDGTYAEEDATHAVKNAWAGYYKATINARAKGNYYGTIEFKNFANSTTELAYYEIGKKETNFLALDDTKVYDGTAWTESQIRTKAAPLANADLGVELTGVAGKLASGTFNANVGEWDVKPVVTEGSLPAVIKNNYSWDEANFQHGTISTTRRPVTVTAKAISETLSASMTVLPTTALNYETTDPIYTDYVTIEEKGEGKGIAVASTEGTYKTEVEDILNGFTIAFADDVDQTVNATYNEGVVIKVKPLTGAGAYTGNYAISGVAGKYTIGGKTITIFADATTITYGDKVPASLKYATSGLSGATIAPTVTYEITKADGTTVVTADANGTLPFDAANYKFKIKDVECELPAGYDELVIDPSPAILTVNKKQIYAKVPAVTLSVGNTIADLNTIGRDKVIFTATDGAEDKVSALVGDDKISYRLGADGITPASPATYTTAITAISDGAKVKVVLVDDEEDDYFVEGNANANYQISVTATALLTDGAGVLILDRTDADLLSKLAAADGKEYTVRLAGYKTTQTLKAGQWYSMILPFEISVAKFSAAMKPVSTAADLNPDGYAIFNLVNETATQPDAVRFKLEMNTIPANTAFLVKPRTDVVLNYKDAGTVGTVEANDNIVEFKNVTITAPEGNIVKDVNGVSFTGVYEQMNMPTGASLYSGDFYTMKDDSHSIDAFAHFWKAAAGARVFVEDIDENGVTAIKEVSTSAIGTIAADGWYTLGGVKLQAAPTEKGVYIKDGKKFVIK